VAGAVGATDNPEAHDRHRDGDQAVNDKEPDHGPRAVDAQTPGRRAHHGASAQAGARNQRAGVISGGTVEAAFGIPEPAANQGINKDDQVAKLSRAEGSDLPEGPGSYDDFMAAEDRPADFATGLVSLAFLKTAIWRGARFWCATAVLGFLIGFGLTVWHPTPYQASTSVLLTYGPYENAASAALDAQAIAQSRAVAGLALHRLGLRESSSSFLAAYSVTVVSNRVLLITTSAPSSDQAVSWANATAAAFLRFRAGQLQTQQEIVLSSLDQQISHARQAVSTISRQIRLASAQPASPQRQAKLGQLQAQRTQSASTLTALLQQASGGQINSATTLAIKDSKVLDTAAPIKFTGKKHRILYSFAGLIAGLALGMGILAVRALASDRLRRRDDVAYALGAPVKLSVGTVGLSRWLPGRHGLAAARLASIRRIVAFLRTATPVPAQGAGAALAVVPSDDPRVAAVSAVSLAVSFAQEGRQVVLADLVSGAPAAGLVGSSKPGVREVRVRDAHLVVAVPEPGDVVPAGPLHRGSQDAGHEPPRKLVAAWASADVLLTLVPLDPSLGGEHLPTWADDAVVFVTAGLSSGTRLHAVGEMIRLAGIASLSAVLVGADKGDDSLGVTYAPGRPAPAGTGAPGATGR
jgi:capsular polysaccharide biosynthesis protein